MEHKHKLTLQMHLPFIKKSKVVLACAGCGNWFSTDKKAFYQVLLTSAPSRLELHHD